MTSTDRAVLLASTRTGVNLLDALDWAGIEGVGLLTGPARYDVVLAGPKGCVTAGPAVDVPAVYEARVFDATAELRWWRDESGNGCAVVLSEDTSRVPADGTPLPPIEIVAALDGGYLLWGSVIDSGPPPWVTLAAARIGSLRVPLTGAGSPDPGSRQRIRLSVKEYVAAEPVHGNAYIAEERLVALSLLGGVE